MFAPLDWEVYQGGSSQSKALCALIISKPAHKHLLQVESRLLQPFCLGAFLSRYGSSSPLCRSLGLGCPACGSTCSLPSWGAHPCGPCGSLLNRSPQETQVSTQCLLSPVLPDYWSLLKLWWYKSTFGSFQLVFHENFFTCRNDVFVGGRAPRPPALPSWLPPYPTPFYSDTIIRSWAYPV